MAWDDIKMQREETIETFVSDYGGEILQLAGGTSSITDLPDGFSARLKITGKCLFDLVLNFAYIFEVSESEANTVNPWRCDWAIYKERHLVECFFQKLKWFRRVATRYDKLDSSFLAFVYLASIAILVK